MTHGPLTIKRLLGTPEDTTWEGVQGVADWSPKFPKWKRKNLHALFPQMSKEGVDLMEVLYTAIRVHLRAADVGVRPAASYFSTRGSEAPLLCRH